MKSVVSYPERGTWGNSKYRGNATGKLIIDLQQVYRTVQKALIMLDHNKCLILLL